MAYKSADFKIDESSKEKVKIACSMIGELLSMLVSISLIFKPKEKAEKTE